MESVQCESCGAGEHGGGAQDGEGALVSGSLGPDVLDVLAQHSNMCHSRVSLTAVKALVAKARTHLP
jgi:hypothetical protein